MLLRKPYKFQKYVKIKNINNSYKNRYKRRFDIFGIKFTIKNKKKAKFYKQKMFIVRKNKLESIRKEISIIKEKYKNNDNADIVIYVISYNHEKTLARCLDSIIEQKTKYNYHIKILDDSSTDSSPEIILEYIKRYPDKIDAIIQPCNTKGKHIATLFRNLYTEYYALVDGDDYWCNENKIERALNYLNNNKNVIMYVHDVNYIDKDSTRSLMHDIQKIPNDIVNPFDIRNIIHSHLSGRVYRNCIDFKKKYVNVRKRDGILNEIYLANGLAYYDDIIMSSYDRTTNGVWTSMSSNQIEYSSFYRIYMSDRTFGFKYNDIFARIYRIKFSKFLRKLLTLEILWKFKILKKRIELELNEIKLIHQKFKKIEKGHNFYTNEEMKLIKRIEEEI